MVDQDENLAPAAEKEAGQPSPEISDKETENFEDAVDASSIRSLTKRNPSATQQQLNEKTESDVEDGSPKSTVQDEKASETDADQQRRSSKRLSSASASSLDNVNLDDDPSASQKEEKAQSGKEASKTISLSSITSALPSMPWSPPPANDPAFRANRTSPPISASAPPPPPPRKLTSAFSWLSRNHTKEPAVTSPPVANSSRRNTASSIGTLTSNPEMMLSRLEEEREDGSGSSSTRNNLKDRFKMLRMREEAGITLANPEDEKNGGSATPGLGVPGQPAASVDERDVGLGVQPPPSPVPPSPNPNLAPGTASGVASGPSANGNASVDWDLWQSVVYEGPAAVARTSAEELNKAIAAGIPNAIRGVIWQVLAQSKNEELEAVYRELVARGTDKEKNRNSNSTASTTSNGALSPPTKDPASSASSIHSDVSPVNGTPSPTTEKDAEGMFRPPQANVVVDQKKKDKEDAAKLQKLEKAIRRDLGARTSFSKFASAQGLQDGLFGVCKAYALFDESVGYAQGMNFIVMPLLFNMPEEEAFCLLVRLMNHYHLRDLFIQDMPGLHKHLYQFERLLEDLEPALYCHLHRRGMSPHLYATQWFLTLFAYRFPLQLVLRIYDLILSEGLSAILRFGIVLMQKNASTLLSMSDMSQLSTFLKDRLFDVYIDSSPSSTSILENGFFGSSSSSIDKEVYRADQLVRDACEVKITPELLKSYAVEWEEKTRVEREREAEIQALRTANANYAARVRQLEEFIQSADRDHAQLANDVVHLKLQNEELKDENESLKGQVRELRIVIEKQPMEIEETWKLERDDLMKRNERVHEENQRLEKELSELEEELVQTKMRYAEINSQHEELSRKWAELKRQFAD
ncbi:hypothetical protein VTK73DRAFT_8502 [Phialemonium thermophilum]|uniref:Rab-GAP TBC domain-containing protein n=1 Tax=Phialemonium thermophilum TaxID=223376 RepID=A0ABR3XNS9_9PEZI